MSAPCPFFAAIIIVYAIAIFYAVRSKVNLPDSGHPTLDLSKCTVVRKRFSKFIDKHPIIFSIVLTFLLAMLWGGIEEYGRARKKEWGSKWENNLKITVYEFNGIFCSFVR